MLWRSIIDTMQAWKEGGTGQSLLITGARQVGKTTAVREFASQVNEQLIEVNFLERPEAAAVLSAATSTDDFLLRLSVVTGSDVIPGETLLFFDEIQECPDVLTWLKFLSERADVETVLSGSLLGLDALPRVRSLPVGFLQTAEMYPLTFEEFARAQGVTEQVWETARAAVATREPVPDYIHNRLIGLFRTYTLVGGMPDAVQRFTETSQLAGVRAVQRSVVDLYKEDISKYVSDPVEARQIRMVYEAIPAQLNAPSKRFKYARLGKNLRFANMETAFDWLRCAGVALEATRVGEVTFPLGLSEDQGSMKVFMNDVGLLTSQLMGEVSLDVIQGKININYGSIYENVVAQELRARGHRLHYYFSKKYGEVDFVVEDRRTGEVALVEVKSGKDYKRHSALSNLLESPGADGRNAVVLCEDNVQTMGDRTYLPVYAVSMR